MSTCDSYCRPCIYSRLDGHHGIIFCDYIGITGMRRGCPAGAGCEKRELGDKRRTIASYVFRGRRDNAEE